MHQQWHPPTEIYVLYVQIEDGVAFTTAGLDPHTKPTGFRWDYNIVEKCGHFDLACREWRQMTTSDQKWSLFKTRFKAADKDLRRGDTTTTTAIYHGDANYVTTIAAYITTTEPIILANTQAALAARKLSLSSALAHQTSFSTPYSTGSG
jgi:hypothetical protein